MLKRAGVPTEMAKRPEMFTLTEAQAMGRWNSICVLKYQRTNGVAQQRVFEKLKYIYKVLIL